MIRNEFINEIIKLQSNQKKYLDRKFLAMGISIFFIAGLIAFWPIQIYVSLVMGLLALISFLFFLYNNLKENKEIKNIIKLALKNPELIVNKTLFDLEVNGSKIQKAINKL